jgi:hypothetical protein
MTLNGYHINKINNYFKILLLCKMMWLIRLMWYNLIGDDDVYIVHAKRINLK